MQREVILADFRAGMDDDFNTARGMATVFDTMRALNRHLDSGEWGNAAACHAAIGDMADVLGVGGQEPNAYLGHALARGLAERDLSSVDIKSLIDERNEARLKRDFKRADEIRDRLKALGVSLEAGPLGTTYKVGVE